MKLTSTYKDLINEYYDSEKLYDKHVIVSRLRKAPRYMWQYIDGLVTVDCLKNGEPHICVKIPQVVYNYLFGEF